MDHQKRKKIRQLRRRRHVRRSITGTAERPRLSVFRSSKHIYAQLIDDLSGATLATASSLSPGVKGEVKYGGNVKAAQAVGKHLAEVAKSKGIDKAAFDRGHYKFHGRVKALAEAANAAGLKCTQSRKPPRPVEPKPAPKAEKKPAEGKKPKKEKKEAEAAAPA